AEAVGGLAGGRTPRSGGHRVPAPTPGDPLEIVTGPHGAFGDTLTAGHGLEQRVGDVIESMLGENSADVGLVLRELLAKSFERIDVGALGKRGLAAAESGYAVLDRERLAQFGGQGIACPRQPRHGEKYGTGQSRAAHDLRPLRVRGSIGLAHIRV